MSQKHKFGRVALGLNADDGTLEVSPGPGTRSVDRCLTLISENVSRA